MNDKFYLKVGGNTVVDDVLATDLASANEDTKRAATAKLEAALKETRVRIGTLLKTDNVSFLFGAGCSLSAGGVGLAAIPIELEKELLAKGTAEGGADLPWLILFYSSLSILTNQQFTSAARRLLVNAAGAPPAKIPCNLEDYLSQLHTWRAALVKPLTTINLGEPLLVATGANLDDLIKQVTRALTKLIDLPAAGKADELRHHRRFIKKILTRPLNLRRANLFTLNYDTLIEQAGDGEGAVLVDGFVGTLKRVFRPESYNLDFYFPAQTTEGRVHRFDRALHLFKLHGSITWHRTEANWENPYGLYATLYNQAAQEDDVMVYPSPLKYGQALGLPYSELFRRFANAIAQPQSVLFVMGYGFGDEHVNALIRQALAIPSFTLIVVDPAPTNDFVKKLEQLGDERVWIVSGFELGTFANFVEKLLPDLREEEIAAKVVKTFRTLDAKVPDEPAPQEPGAAQ